MADKIQLIKEEIERRLQLLRNGDADTEVMKRVDGVIKAYKSIIDFIDSLPEEPASEDLEEEIEIYSNNVHFPICYDDYKRFARHFAEWQKQKNMQDFLEKACKWWSTIPDDTYGFNPCKGFIEQFKNYMQNEMQD